jgi:hypothetical protein
METHHKRQHMLATHLPKHPTAPALNQADSMQTHSAHRTLNNPTPPHVKPTQYPKRQLRIVDTQISSGGEGKQMSASAVSTPKIKHKPLAYNEI